MEARPLLSTGSACSTFCPVSAASIATTLGGSCLPTPIRIAACALVVADERLRLLPKETSQPELTTDYEVRAAHGLPS
eukprot:589677-Pleurochrysis_carterae.AAC.1